MKRWYPSSLTLPSFDHKLTPSPFVTLSFHTACSPGLKLTGNYDADQLATEGMLKSKKYMLKKYT